MNYLIDPTFTRVKRLFVQSFERIAGEKNATTTGHRDSFSNYYVSIIKIKDFNVLTDKKSFFALPVKNEEETYEKSIDMSKNDEYINGNLLDFAYFKKHYRLIAIHLSKQTNLKDLQQINFIEKLEVQDHGATMFFIIETSEETTFEYFTKFCQYLIKMDMQKIVSLLNSSDNKLQQKIVRY